MRWFHLRRDDSTYARLMCDRATSGAISVLLLCDSHSTHASHTVALALSLRISSVLDAKPMLPNRGAAAGGRSCKLLDAAVRR